MACRAAAICQQVSVSCSVTLSQMAALQAVFVCCIMASVLFLGAFRDGTVRPSVQADALRSRYRLPAETYLRRLLDDAGGPGLHTRVLASLSTGLPEGAYEYCGLEQSYPFAVPIVALLKID